MNKKETLWLHKELPSWEEKGWITSEGANQLKAHYGVINKTGPSLSRLLILLGGALLVGLGIFLLFAGYWYSFSPNGRFDWALALVVLALVVTGVGLAKAERGSAVAEGISVFYMLALTASTLLVADTYYTGEYAGIYVFLILLFTLPIMYLLDSGITLILYLLGSMGWSFSSHATNIWVGPPAVWLLLLLAMPYYGMRMRKGNKEDSLLAWMSWAFVAAIFGVVFFTLSAFQGPMNLFFVGALSTCTYCIGCTPTTKSMWTIPFRGIGMLGLLYSVIYGTWIRSWTDIQGYSIPFWLIGMSLVVLGLCSYVLVYLYNRKKIGELLVGLMPFVIAFGYVLAQNGMSGFIISVLFNLYVVFVAAGLIIRGTITKRISLVNASVAGLVCMFGARFFDPSFTFVERGVAFIVVGILVFAANALYMRRKQKSRARINRSVKVARKTIEESQIEAQVESSINMKPRHIVEVDPVMESQTRPNVEGQFRPSVEVQYTSSAENQPKSSADGQFRSSIDSQFRKQKEERHEVK